MKQEEVSTYPFEIYENEGRFVIKADIEGVLSPIYSPVFTRNGYSGNGYCWEGHITQILEKEDRELLKYLQFDPEAGGFWVFAKSEEYQLRFVQVLAPIFSDTKRLEKYIQSADRRRVDD